MSFLATELRYSGHTLLPKPPPQAEELNQQECQEAMGRSAKMLREERILLKLTHYPKENPQGNFETYCRNCC